MVESWLHALTLGRILQMVYRSCAGNHFVLQHSNQWPPNSLSSKHHSSFGLPRLLGDDQKRLKINVWRAGGPLLIKATNALGKTGKQKRKWSETTERAGSKHLMECPACWANRLLQIERNSRRLNRATWNISSCSFSPVPIGKAGQKRGGGKNLLPLFGTVQVAFIHLQSILGIGLQLNPMWRRGKIFCAVLPCWNKYMCFRILSVCTKEKTFALMQLYGEDTWWPQSSCELYSLADCHLSSTILFECPSWNVDMVINNPSVRWGNTQAEVWQVHPTNVQSAKRLVRHDQLLADSLLGFWHSVIHWKCEPSKRPVQKWKHFAVRLVSSLWSK